MDARLRKKGWMVIATFAAMVAYVVYAHHAPGGGFIGCPFHALSGLSCFGCGMTRSTGHFLHGDVAGALRFHPFGPAFVVAFAAASLHYLVQNLRGEVLDYRALRVWRRIQTPVLIGTLLALLGFGAARLTMELLGILTPI